MAPKPPSSDDQNPAAADDPELDEEARSWKLRGGAATGGKAAGSSPTTTKTTTRTTSWSSTTMMMTRISSSSPPRKPPARWRRSTASSSRILKNYKKLLAFVGLRRPGRDAVQRHHAAEPEIPDRRRARRGGFSGAVQDPRRARGRRHRHLDHRGLVRALGCAAGGVHSLPTCGRGCSSTSRTCRRPILPAPSAAKFSRASRSTLRPSKARSRPLPTARRCRSWN